MEISACVDFTLLMDVITDLPLVSIKNAKQILTFEFHNFCGISAHIKNLKRKRNEQISLYEREIP